MEFNLKNIRTWNSRNGYGMSATLTANNKDVCNFHDQGDGSQPTFDVINQLLYQEVLEKVDALPPYFWVEYEMEMKVDLALFIDILHYSLETKTEFKLIAA